MRWSGGKPGRPVDLWWRLGQAILGPALLQDPEDIGKNLCVATLILLVGLPGAGKTTLARRLATDHGALRLTPDEWMIPLFGDSLAGGKRFVLEGRMITLALQLLRLETNVVLDFGCWAKDERSALRWLTQREGGSFQLVYVPIERRAQLERIGGLQTTPSP
jgi:predicted kinase